MKKKIVTKLNSYNHKRIKDLADGSIDNNLNVLMDTVEDEMPFVDYSEKMVAINAYSDTMDRLDGFHITTSESRDNIVTRLLLKYDEIQKVDTLFVPFKLTSLLNKELVITGVVEYYTTEISFNESDGIFSKKLPDTYTFNGKNLTVEFNSWKVLINWAEIKNIIINKATERYQTEIQNCYLEVNYL